ncbi:MAG: hypothetical protein ACRDTD_14910 [Pseudonocardiaceae bacterium]
MSNVWKTRDGLSLEHLEKVAGQLRSKEPIAPAELEEQLARLLTGVVILLRQHRVNKRGQCEYCRWTRWTWRVWHRRPQCTVYRSLDFAMKQPLDAVWQRLLEDHKTLPNFG